MPHAAPIVLITGARSGLGRAIAHRFARAGYTVLGGLRDIASAPELLEGAEGELIPVQLDITSDSDRKAVAAHIEQTYGRLDLLINNAGIGLGGFLELVDEDELRRSFEINVFGTWALTNTLLPMLRKGRDPMLMNVSSMAGRMAFAGLGVYASTKFALEGLTEAWRHELALFGIRVVSLQPGSYKTDIWTRNRQVSRRAHAQDTPYGAVFAHLEAKYAKVAETRARPATEFADYVFGVAQDTSPKLRHPTGPGAKLRTVLVRFAPSGFTERLLQRVLGLNTFLP